MQRPPERIELPSGVVLRRLRSDDVDALQAVIEVSREHLRPFMPWADQDHETTAAFIAKASEGWEAGESFAYAVTESEAAAASGCSAAAGCTGAAGRNRWRSATGCAPTRSAEA